jgi:hypothetical protein
MANLKLKAPSGGSLSLVSADGASDLTVTFPAVTGTAMVSGNMPAFSAYQGTQQSISTNTWTKIPLSTELFDTNNNFDSSTNYRFTPTVAGYYQISASLRVLGTSASNQICAIYKNGSAFYSSDNYGGATGNLPQYMSITLSTLIYLNGSTDYIELWGYSNGSSPLFLGGNGGANLPPWNTYMTGSLVRAA